jgi:hypothetical protein
MFLTLFHELLIMRFALHTIKKLNGDDLVKIIKEFRSKILIFFYQLLHLFIDIYYDKSKLLIISIIYYNKSLSFNL